MEGNVHLRTADSSECPSTVSAPPKDGRGLWNSTKQGVAALARTNGDRNQPGYIRTKSGKVTCEPRTRRCDLPDESYTCKRNAVVSWLHGPGRGRGWRTAYKWLGARTTTCTRRSPCDSHGHEDSRARPSVAFPLFVSAPVPKASASGDGACCEEGEAMETDGRAFGS
eukprot:scaffold774_cov330-Pavlova_lutheri.AAC.5